MRTTFGLISSVLTLSLLAGGCGGDSKLAAPSTDLTGTWLVSVTMGSNTCGDTPGVTDTSMVTITHQAGSNSFTISDGSTGTIDGNRVSFASSGPAGNCTISLSVTSSVTLDPSGDIGTGSASFTCTWTGGSCNGTDSVTVTRQK